MATGPFQWIGNQAVSTPEAARRQRAVAESLIGRSSTPAQNWGQGLNHIASALTGTVLQGRADEAEAAGRGEIAAMLAGLSPDSGFSDIAAALSNPWIADNPGASSIASALLGQNLQRNDPMYQMQLERAGLELEALRNPAPAAPVFEGGQWWDIASGQPNALTEANVDPTANMQDYNAYAQYEVANGREPLGPLEYAQAVRSSGATNINVGAEGQRTGPIPAGMAIVDDPTNPSGFRLEMIPNSPAEVEAAAAAEQAAMRGEQSGRYADVVLEDIDRALGLIGGDTTGVMGALLQQIPGTSSRNLDALLQTVRSNIGFDRLQAMREASPTGGALGAVSDFENRQLQATLGNLEQSQSEEQLRRNLERVKEVYVDIMRKAAAYPNAAEFGFDGFIAPEAGAGEAVDYNAEQAPPNWTGSPDLWKYLSPEDRALWK